MTENMKIAMTAINKFIYFSWNYDLVYHTWNAGSGTTKEETVPEFLAKIKWTCNFDHMYSKWKLAIMNDNPNEYLIKFYAELDNENRKLLLEWVMENYNDERKLNI